MAPVEAIITPTLKQAIAKADALDAAWQKKNPGEKPPLGDGLPWQASPDYTANCIAGDSATTGKDARVSISYAFADDPAGNYTDMLELKPVFDKDIGDNVWGLDDVMFADKSTMDADVGPNTNTFAALLPPNAGGPATCTIFGQSGQILYTGPILS